MLFYLRLEFLLLFLKLESYFVVVWKLESNSGVVWKLEFLLSLLFLKLESYFVIFWKLVVVVFLLESLNLNFVVVWKFKS